VVARINPKTGEVESLEVLFFSTRLLRSDLFEMPVNADLHRASPLRAGSPPPGLKQTH
jgi:trehalose-6-phosphate synthase